MVYQNGGTGEKEKKAKSCGNEGTGWGKINFTRGKRGTP